MFSRLLGQEQFTDVVVTAEGRHVKCHKMVLSACSSYFEQLFMNFNEPHQIVILKDTSFNDIVAIIEFMYKGEINVSQDKLSSLLKTAENLKVKGLAEVSGEDSKPPTLPTTTTTARSTSLLHTIPRFPGGPPPMQMLGRPAPTSSHLSDPLTLNGEVKRKRGRPRTLDGPQDDNACFGPRITSVQGSGGPMGSLAASSLLGQSLAGPLAPTTGQLALAYSPMKAKAHTAQAMSPLQAALNRPLETKVATPSPPVSAPATPPLATPPLAIKQEKPDQIEGGGTSFRSNNNNNGNNTTNNTNSNTSYNTNTNTNANNTNKTPDTNTNKNNADTNSSSSNSNPNSKPTNPSPDNIPTHDPSTFVSSLTTEQIASWGIVKMNDYLVSGTRQQYWEEYFVKHVMSAVKNKEIDMKGAAELLGVSYGTLYGRYRETFGYLKHAWNVTGRPQKKTNLWTDPNTRQILESMRSGAINIKQAAEALGMEPAMLAYQLAGKVSADAMSQGKLLDQNGLEEEDPGSYDGEDYREEMMEVQPDIIFEQEQEEMEQFDSIVEEEGVDPIQS